MYVGKTVFAQLMEFVPWTSFGRIVDRYGGNAGVRRMTCAEQLRVMAFAQLTWRESLRDIEVTLAAYPRANWTPSPRQNLGPNPLVWSAAEPHEQQEEETDYLYACSPSCVRIAAPAVGRAPFASVYGKVLLCNTLVR